MDPAPENVHPGSRRSDEPPDLDLPKEEEREGETTMNKTREMSDVAAVILTLLLIEIILSVYLYWGDFIQQAVTFLRYMH